MRTPDMPAIDWRWAAALIGLIALGPVLTIGGAKMLERDALATAARVQAEAAPRIAAAAQDHDARELLRAAVRRPTASVWLDRVAAALPAEARVARMTQAADGAVELEITAPDPDPVRTALRRDPAFAGFREAGQRRAGALILIRYRRAA
ncbi:hypothetical protein BFL28_10095 [Sphingomonas turrisvirgatae]|uniref:Uncharacterized protein n=2 Tax=Sphingomonas turrisvirgatae TaxID=1888892 RepID=A0A1E3M0F5_9SPHN|nr:hypothetical protein BFL28_10095 [Sphingomonas turrisvirgatae]